MTVEEVEETIARSSEWMNGDPDRPTAWYIAMDTRDLGAFLINKCISYHKKKGTDMSFFIDNYPMEISLPDIYITTDDYLNADEDTRKFWARLYAIDSCVGEEYFVIP